MNQLGLSKLAEKEYKGVSVIAVFRKDGKVLLGRRRDNALWTNPGGHIEGSEKPIVAAQRELKEETGIDIPVDKFIKLGPGKKVVAVNKAKLEIFPFGVEYEGPVTGSSDPDGEINKWKWCNSEDLEQEVKENLHVPKENVLFDRLGIKY